MATCPRCKGHLTESHRCPRRPLFVAIEVILWGIAGAFAGVLLVALFDRHGQISDSDYTISAAAGVLIAVGLNRALRH